MTDSSRTSIALLSLACLLVAGQMLAESPALKLRATAIGSSAPLTIDLFRWSTDAERAPLHTALAAPPPPPPTPAAPANAAGGRGRAARGGRGAPAAPLSPEARLTAAVKTAPTFGYIWSDGATGFSIKYAWRAPASDNGVERIVLVTDRRMGMQNASGPAPSGATGEGDFTVIEMRLDAKGNGEAKTSMATRVVMDTAANTLALDGYASAPTQLKVTR